MIHKGPDHRIRMIEQQRQRNNLVVIERENQIKQMVSEQKEQIDTNMQTIAGN